MKFLIIKFFLTKGEVLSKEMIKLCDDLKLDLILTTGGTGFSPRDWTPEATLDIIHRQAPGISEAMRANSISITPKGMLSRGCIWNT